MGLGRVFDDAQSAPCGDLRDRVEVGGMPIEMNWNHRAGPRGDRLFQGRRVEREGGLVDFAEANPRSQASHHFRGGDEGVRRKNDLISRGDPGDEQGQVEAGGAGGDPEGVRDAEVAGELRLEGVHLWAADECGRLHRLAHRREPSERRQPAGSPWRRRSPTSSVSSGSTVPSCRLMPSVDSR